MQRRNQLNYNKFLLTDEPYFNYPYVDNDGSEFFINRKGVLMFKNKPISDDYLKSKYGVIQLDLFCLKNSTRFVYKGMNNTAKSLVKNESAKLSVTLYHDFVSGFPVTINDLKVTDRVDKIKTICEKIKNNVEIQNLFWKGEDLLKFKGTFQELFLLKNMWFEEFYLEIDCEVKLTEFTSIKKNIDHYTYCFASFEIDEDDLCDRLMFTLKENWGGFVTLLGFGAADESRGVCQMSYEVAIEEVKDLLLFKNVKQSEINRLSFKKLSISDKDPSKYAIQIGISQLKKKHKQDKTKLLQKTQNQVKVQKSSSDKANSLNSTSTAISID